MIADFYEIDPSRSNAIQPVPPERLASLEALSRTARELGLTPLGVRVRMGRLLSGLPLPCIAFWPIGHYVIVYETTKAEVLIADPGLGLLSLDQDRFKEHWCDPRRDDEAGTLLLLEFDGLERADVHTEGE